MMTLVAANFGLFTSWDDVPSGATKSYTFYCTTETFLTVQNVYESKIGNKILKEIYSHPVQDTSRSMPRCATAKRIFFPQTSYILKMFSNS